MTQNLSKTLALCALIGSLTLGIKPTAARATEMTQAELEALARDPNNEMTGQLKLRAHDSQLFTLDPLNAFLGGEAIGFYSDGHLLNAARIDDEGDGFTKIFRPRDRRWATDVLASILPSVAHELAIQFPGGERIQIGDVANHDGGVASGHASHQNGLDSDIAFLRVNHQEQDPNDVSGFMEKFVTPSNKLTANYDVPRNFALIEGFVSTGRVNRIFVDKVIKKALCNYAQRQNWLPEKDEVLRRLRHWPDHQDHMHVRLTCPENSPQCTPQEDPPAGNGCNEV